MCSPSDESCDGQLILFASLLQLDQEIAAPACQRILSSLAATESRSAARTIKYCDSPYHILATNVNTPHPRDTWRTRNTRLCSNTLSKEITRVIQRLCLSFCLDFSEVRFMELREQSVRRLARCATARALGWLPIAAAGPPCNEFSLPQPAQALRAHPAACLPRSPECELPMTP